MNLQNIMLTAVTQFQKSEMESQSSFIYNTIVTKDVKHNFTFSQLFETHILKI